MYFPPRLITIHFLTELVEYLIKDQSTIFFDNSLDYVWILLGEN